MKINKDDVGIGYTFRSYDQDDDKWYLTEIIRMSNNVLTLMDVDPLSAWQGMEWEVSIEDLQDESQHKSSVDDK
jgi:hypothetical protein